MAFEVSGPQPTGSATRSAAQLDAALQQLAPPGVLVGARAITASDLGGLFPVERAAIANSVPARQVEFASGRALLRSLVGENTPIPVGIDRAPVLPAGVRASLAHDARFAVAAVSRDPDVHSIGIDVEPVVPLSAEMAEVILRPDERHLDAHLAFTLKEATYKAWSRLGGRMLEFHDVRLAVGAGSFAADVVADEAHFNGLFVNVGDRWAALVVVTHGARSIGRPGEFLGRRMSRSAV